MSFQKDSSFLTAARTAGAAVVCKECCRNQLPYLCLNDEARSPGSYPSVCTQSKCLYARPGQAESQVDRNFQVESTCGSFWPGLTANYL